MTKKTLAERLQDAIGYGFALGGGLAVGASYIMNALNDIVGSVIMTPASAASLAFGTGFVLSFLLGVERHRKSKEENK